MTDQVLPLVSVILCTFNPRADYLGATLDSLRRQDLPQDRWELILVDNNSMPPVQGGWDLSWHRASRIVLERSQGLARARRRGYLEARGELVVHSDDDNILAPDYLSVAWRIHQKFPHIGTFGGKLIPRFETEPRSALERSFGEERIPDADHWSNLVDDGRTMPWGAGMCLRRAVVNAYLEQVERDPRRLMLGRTGERLLTGEDLDMNFVAVGSGYGTGLFRALSLEHFIPVKHLSEEHQIRYKGEANGYSVTILKFLHFGLTQPPQVSVPARVLRGLRRSLRMNSFERRRQRAWDKGVREALVDMKRWGWFDSVGNAK